MPGYLKKLKTKKVAIEPRDCPIHGTFVLSVVLPDQSTLDAERPQTLYSKGPKKGEFAKEKWAPVFVKNRIRGWSGLTEDVFFGYLSMGLYGYDRNNPELKKLFADHNGEFPFSPEEAADMLLVVYDDTILTPVLEFLNSWKAELSEGDEAADKSSPESRAIH